jgi:hypothetical protein
MEGVEGRREGEGEEGSREGRKVVSEGDRQVESEIREKYVATELFSKHAQIEGNPAQGRRSFSRQMQSSDCWRGEEEEGGRDGGTGGRGEKGGLREGTGGREG